MAPKKTLNAKNLEALGASRLAELLIEFSTGNAAAKRRLRLELAGTDGSDEVAREVRKRLASIARSRSFVDWQKRKELVNDLETQRRAIVDHIAKQDPASALDLIWQFLALADPVFNRCDDSSGAVIEIFHTACRDLGEIALKTRADPIKLADRAFEALKDNGYGQYDHLIEMLTPALGQAGLEHLKAHMHALEKQPVKKPAKKDREIIGYGSRGPIYADDIAESSRVSTVRLALMEIADAQGDVDTYIDQYDEQARTMPGIAARIAVRLVKADRADEALRIVEAAGPNRGGWPDFDWVNARIDVLEALGRKEDAQAARWSCFETTLSTDHLRAFLKELPDFEDVEAEDRALAYVRAFASVLHALHFLVGWSALEKAAELVIQRAGELVGDHYEVLTPAANALAGKYPLAATIILRSMIDFSLTKGRSSRYRHAARHLMECASLASVIPDFGAIESHDAYEARLRREHGRKTSFWDQVS